MTEQKQTTSSIALVTANARYFHASLALRYLYANLGSRATDSVIMEFIIADNAADIAEKILRVNPSVVLFSVYIWNSELLTEVASLLKSLCPKMRLAAGGPELLCYPETHPIFPLVDLVVIGEGEQVIGSIVEELLNAKALNQKVVFAPSANLESLELPYVHYSDEDIRHRILYIETSRGCPLSCDFCISALDKKVRRFPIHKVLSELEVLWSRGARQFKFVDRALHSSISPELLDFFLEKKDPSLFLHFELIPDRLPEKLLSRFRAFPEGQVQLEAGIQTLNEDVCRRINRKQNLEKALHNIKTLRENTGVHIHTDLIVGLPGESLSSFAQGFDRLFAHNPHEIQVGILKKLRGASISRHDEEWQMIYNSKPPYELLQNRDLDFSCMQNLKRFAKFFDLVFNRCHFKHLAPAIIKNDSPFERLMHLSSWLYKKEGRSFGISLNRLGGLLLQYAIEEKGISNIEAEELLKIDLSQTKRQPKKTESENNPIINNSNICSKRQKRALSNQS